MQTVATNFKGDLKKPRIIPLASCWSDCSEYFLGGNPEPGVVSLDIGGNTVNAQCFDGWTAVLARNQVQEAVS